MALSPSRVGIRFDMHFGLITFMIWASLVLRGMLGLKAMVLDRAVGWSPWSSITLFRSTI